MMQRRNLMEHRASPTVPPRSLIDERVPPLGTERNKTQVRKLLITSFAVMLVCIVFVIST